MNESPPKTDAECVNAMRLLVQEIMDEFSYPERWPMTDAERVRFIRTIFRQAKAIATSEPFL